MWETLSAFAQGGAQSESHPLLTVCHGWVHSASADCLALPVFAVAGRYCGRIAGLPPAEELVPILGLKCGGFTFRWRVGGSCSAGIARGLPADSLEGDTAGGSPVSPGAAAAAAGGAAAADGAGQNITDVDSMLVREQMMHEDPEAPWQCKVRTVAGCQWADSSGV